MPDDPLVSIVTPSYNMADFLEETIRSVLCQDYPAVEYIVMDGGSTDGTLEILERYRDRLRFVSAADAGAADAVNRGFEAAHGSIFAWLNADDTYLPGAIRAAVEHLGAHPDAGAVYGQAFWVDSGGRLLGRYPTAPYEPDRLARECFICQPACFMRSSLFRSAGMLDTSFESAFDYDLWIRLSRQGRFVMISEDLATSRMHRSNKTLSQRGLMFGEVFRLLKRHYSYVPAAWINAYCAYLIDGRDQFYQPFRGSALKYAATLPMGWWHNWKHPWRYGRDWYALSGARRLRSR